MERLFFLIFASVAVVSALCVVLFRNPVRSALALMLCLLQVACVFVLLRSPFLAVVQVFVYVGAVMVLFLFVVMILDIRQAELEAFFPPRNRWLMYAIIPVITFEFLLVILGTSFEGFGPGAGGETKVEVIGRALFTEYLLPFEVVSVLLLVAMVGAIVMAKKRWD
ncbi:MAG: NADH-quinone oxidoreductase subunit J [Deltaproteobacteria bacterium]|nr:NADH-quinone oxidoreductase subunit J [Deltaproteobacteria bacterium]